MNKFIGVIILIIGLIASVIEIYAFVKEEYPWFIQQFNQENSPTTQPQLEQPSSPIDLESWKRKTQVMNPTPTDLTEPETQPQLRRPNPVPKYPINVDDWIQQKKE